jgi:hypothetical protein
VVSELAIDGPRGTAQAIPFRGNVFYMVGRQDEDIYGEKLSRDGPFTSKFQKLEGHIAPPTAHGALSLDIGSAVPTY